MSVLPEAQCDENFSGWRPLHYSSPKARRMMERLILELGADVDVFLEGVTYLVPRHYIALHELKASELPNLGFPIKNDPPQI